MLWRFTENKLVCVMRIVPLNSKGCWPLGLVDLTKIVL